MKSGTIIRNTIACLALLSLTGCLQGDNDRRNEWVTVSPGANMGNATMYRDIQFADIPVPAGYSIMNYESYSFQGALFRNGILKYQGPVDWSFALTFYRNQLPARGWKLDKTEKGFDSRIMYFSKGQEKLIAIITQVPGGSRTELQLDNIAKNDLLLKGKLTDPGYTDMPTYMRQQPAPQQPGMQMMPPGTAQMPGY